MDYKAREQANLEFRKGLNVGDEVLVHNRYAPKIVKVVAADARTVTVAMFGKFSRKTGYPTDRASSMHHIGLITEADRNAASIRKQWAALAALTARVQHREAPSGCGLPEIAAAIAALEAVFGGETKPAVEQ
jgi:hypothetical protein